MGLHHPGKGKKGNRRWTSLLIKHGGIQREQEVWGQPKRWWKFIHIYNFCHLCSSDTLRIYNALEILMLISHNKKLGIVKISIGGNADIWGGTMGWSFPRYQGYMWNMKIGIPLWYDRVQDSYLEQEFWMTTLDWVGIRLNQFEMFEEHENCLSRQKQCCSKLWNSVEWKPCINREVKSLELSI